MILVIGILFLAVCSLCCSQDLQFGCISCADKFDKCELDCSWSLQGSDVQTVTECQYDCLVDKRQCVDSTEVEACSTCTLLCSEQYDTSLRRCLTMISRKTKSTYHYPDDISSCDRSAASVMDDCMNLCGKY